MGKTRISSTDLIWIFRERLVAAGSRRDTPIMTPPLQSCLTTEAGGRSRANITSNVFRSARAWLEKLRKNSDKSISWNVESSLSIAKLGLKVKGKT